MSYSKQAVLKLLERGRERRDQPFRLSSGEWSHDYIDAKLAISTAAGLRTAAEGVLALVEEEGLQFDAVGGLTMGADPLAHAISLLSGKAWFSVRKQPKEHGRQRRLEGAILSAGTRALLVDDVVTTGKSIVQAVEAVTEVGAPVVLAVALVDRGETTRAQLESRNLRYRPLLTYHDLGIDPVGIAPRGAPHV